MRKRMGSGLSRKRMGSGLSISYDIERPDHFFLTSTASLGVDRRSRMATYWTTLETDEGQVHVVSRSRWLYIFPMPYTSVVPHRTADLARFGTSIRWQNGAALKTCHEAVISLVKERGLSGVASIAESEKNNARIAKELGMTYQELVDQAMRSRGPIPDLDNVLKYATKFF